MDIYLPVAEMSVNLFLLLGLGGVVGFLSGVFGVGGGFLLTPFLIFIGIPPAVAVGTQASQILASSLSGVMAHMRRGNVDVRMGSVLVVGGLVGAVIGVWLFALLSRLGQIDLSISLAYLLFLGTVGLLMLFESVVAWFKVRRRGGTGFTKRHRHLWLHHLPLKMRFQRSRLYISALMPLALGVGAAGAELAQHLEARDLGHLARARAAQARDLVRVPPQRVDEQLVEFDAATQVGQQALRLLAAEVVLVHEEGEELRVFHGALRRDSSRARAPGAGPPR
jgi:hypothetical protein